MDEQGLIQTPSDDHDYDFAAAEKEEDEMSLGNVDEMQSNAAPSEQPSVARKAKKDKKHKKDKKKKDKKDKKSSRHLTRHTDSIKEEDLPPVAESDRPQTTSKDADDGDVVGKKRRVKRNIVEDDDEEQPAQVKRQKTE